MVPAPRPVITFSRLTTVPLDAIRAHMSDPRVTVHMPLAAGKYWDEKACAEFVAHKEAFWQRDGLGHWAILAGGRYAGWGGFQKEGDEWDFGLVLEHGFFGLGLAVTNRAIAFARADARIPYVTFLLPPSRRHLGGLGRWGARMIGEVDYQGSLFRKYRLETA